jgi:tetratricopeptide (TPR) repeat protein
MALGFGFNKAKVLASAEKYVQQGKLQNAISEYQKVLKEDPKDLTVLNTVGDLFSRIGKGEDAAKCFQKVGEQYASDGFTVKAIAMYKKLTKISSTIETLQRLAELYTIQGLYNDARGQYVQVADAHLKNGNNDDAAKIFQKILELDPDNTAMQQKLADLYIKLGKKAEAVNIYLTAAQNLFIKQAMDQAEEACVKVLSIEKENVEAKVLRGTIAAESGDGKTAYECLKDLPNLDSRSDALRSMLRAQLALKKLDEAEPLVSKLVTVHNDLSGVSWYADALLAENRFAEGVAVYEQYAEKVLAAQGPQLVKQLSAMTARVKDSSKALVSLQNLFRKAGDSTHDGEITELLAHAYVEEGELHKAKDLYKQLAESEPENPLHAQNYKQVVSKLGEDTASQISAEQGAQALMAEELDSKAENIQQEYSAEVASAVQQALTDAELFDSYNLPAKSIPPLELGLKVAPKDVRINQRLAAAYLKVQRFADAARCYSTLEDIFAAAGHKDDAAKYGEMAASYSARPTADAVVAETLAPAISMSVEEPPAMAMSAATTAEAAPVIEVAPPAAETEPQGGSHEIAIDDWESMMTVEEPAPASAQSISIDVAPAAPVAEFATSVELPAAEATMEVTSSSDGAAVAEFSFEVQPEVPATAPASTFEVPVEAPAIDIPMEPPAAAEVIVEAPKPEPPKQAPPAPAAAPTRAPAAPARPVAAAPIASADDDILGDLVSDLEDSLGDSFLEEAKPAAAAKSEPPKPAPTIASPPPAAMPATAASAAAPAPAKSAAPPVTVEVHEEAASALSDLFDEFKEDAEESAGEAEDPDTHYNLGIAFKEMGLLDEAIGELQKVAKAIDQGHPFAQQMQAYTWLAQCLVDKGVPQAAVRWYERALKVNDINEESKLAVYYDLGNAYELAGNRQKAHDTFLEVYSANIDYRDVADRIKALKN